jgi:hypothetical protein
MADRDELARQELWPLPNQTIDPEALEKLDQIDPTKTKWVAARKWAITNPARRNAWQERPYVGRRSIHAGNQQTED